MHLLNSDISDIHEPSKAGRDVIGLTDTWDDKERNRVERVKLQKWRKLGKPNGGNFDEVHVIGDGNCFYMCISMHLFGTENKQREVREDIFMTQNKSQFECLLMVQWNLILENIN